MRECPNCGQPAARTEDWACQWCAYPLVSESYEKMPKTYKELKKEKLTGQKLPETKLPKREPLVREEIKATPLPSHEILPPTHTPESEPELVSEPESISAPKPESVAEPKPELMPTAIEVTVEELCSAYETDKVATDAKFTGRIIKVTGIMDRIIDGFLLIDIPNTDVVVLDGANEEAGWFVLCEFDKKHGPELNQLTIGQMITVQGKCDGYKADIHIRDCVLVGWE